MDWTPVYSVGNDLLDEQHRVLFAIITELQAYLESDDPAGGVAESLTRLVRYTKEHFTLEEQMMADAGYRGLSQHRAAHDVLCARLDQISDRLNKGDPTVRQDLYFLLVSEWLASHILGMDKRYVPALQILSPATTT